MKKKLIYCSKCGKSSFWIEKRELSSSPEISKNPTEKKQEWNSSPNQDSWEELIIVTEIKQIIHTDKTPYEKKIDLLNWLKDLPVGKLTSNEKQKLQGRFSNEVSEQKAEEHRKKTAEDFDKMIETLLSTPTK